MGITVRPATSGTRPISVPFRRTPPPPRLFRRETGAATAPSKQIRVVSRSVSAARVAKARSRDQRHRRAYAAADGRLRQSLSPDGTGPGGVGGKAVFIQRLMVCPVIAVLQGHGDEPLAVFLRHNSPASGPPPSYIPFSDPDSHLHNAAACCGSSWSVPRW